MTKEPLRPRAYSYLRFSTPEQMKGDSHRRQTDLATQYAARNGLDLDTSSFQDLGVSAYRGDNAETGELRRFRNAVEDGLIPKGSYLLVESLDRLSRNHILDAQTLLTSIITAGVTVVTLQGTERAYSRKTLEENPADLIFAILDMIRAHSESATKAARLKEAWKSKRSQLGTRNLTSIAPAWLKPRPAKDGFDIILHRAEIVRGIFADYLRGVGKDAIAAGLNKAAEPPFGRAAFWRKSYIHKILVNPAVVGTFVPHTEEQKDGRTIRTPCEAVPDYFPAVIDQDTFQAAQAMQGVAGKGSPARPRSGGVRHLLAGLAQCPLCHSSMTRVSKGSGAKAGPPYLVCTRAKTGGECTYKTVRVSNIHEALCAGASFIVGTAPTGEDDLDDEWHKLQGRRDAIDAGMEHLVDELSRGGESRAIRKRLDTLQLERDRIAEALDALAERIAATASVFVDKALADLEGALQGDPASLDVPRANAAMRRVLQRVTVDYVNGDLVMGWKQGGETRLTYAMPAT
ncbi:recombinase family protein [Variovorax defluvii]|uniref:Recombinase family protein n=1 Tax=Variovorax defluvii TaxID=913761 RepID=A0ABP8IG81_9BURK